MAIYLGRSGQKEGPVMQKTILLLISLWLSTEVQAQTPFYQGKTITLIVGSGAGTAYDIYARLLGSYVGKYLPGNPTVVVQNMPAADGMMAANFVYGVAKPDGLTVASINPAHYFNQLQGNKEVKFDWPLHLACELRQVRTYALHAHGRAVQIDAGYPQSNDRTAQVRCNRYRHQRSLY